jgi:CubicO group peptidase (beta-lactamase class C family)
MMRRGTVLLLSMSALLSTCSAPHSAGHDGARAGESDLVPPTREELAHRLDRYLEPLVDAGQLSGRLLVRLGTRPAIVRGFGHADLELGVDVGPTTRFNVASVTKTMTNIALIGLIDDEVLAPADPIATWLPAFPHGSEISVEMLARHRAGIPHRVTKESQETVPYTAADVAALAAGATLEFAPGERESYSSAGYSVLARVMELASGSSYQQLLEHYVFAPAGMTDSQHADARQILLGRASSYLVGVSGRPVNAPLKDLSFLVGAGSVWSTAEDLERMVCTLCDGGYGDLARQTLVHESGFHVNGATSGFRAFVDWYREPELTVVFTGNLMTGVADLVRASVARLASGERLAPPEPPTMVPVEVAHETLERYEGSYRLRPGRDLQVSAVPGGLQIGSWILVPTGERTFVSPQDYATITFIMGGDGRPVRLDWTAGGTTSEMPRVEDPEHSSRGAGP